RKDENNTNILTSPTSTAPNAGNSPIQQYIEPVKGGKGLPNAQKLNFKATSYAYKNNKQNIKLSDEGLNNYEEVAGEQISKGATLGRSNGKNDGIAMQSNYMTNYGSNIKNDNLQ